ncbi:MAG: glutathione S-transferase [Sulfuritalea sp.]|jgi:glutathione S-transferase|nr:glutathione S-transferase [Sulfuritalea sp.]
MITLCGFAVSNYYNIVKHALLEKGVAFAEEHVLTRSKDEAVLSASPLGKIPFIKTAQGALCESAVILDYLEDQYPAHPLLPQDAFEAAKVREMVTFINLHLELVARELYGQAFFGGTVSDELKATVKKQLVRNIDAFKRLVKFSPFIAGDTFTLADCVAFSNLPLIGMATRGVLGEDLLLAAGMDYKPYIKMIGERESSVRVAADRKAANTKP